MSNHRVSVRVRDSIGLALGLMVISGCALGAEATDSDASAPPASTATASPPLNAASPSASATAEPFDTTVTALIVGSDGVTTANSSGDSVLKITYFEPVETVVNEFTRLFGVAPAVTEYDGTPRDFEWPGVRILTDGPGKEPYSATWAVALTVPELAGIPIDTPTGVGVGDDSADSEAANPDSVYEFDRQGVPTVWVSVDEAALDATGERTFAVQVTATPEGTVTELFAPHKNFE